MRWLLWVAWVTAGCGEDGRYTGFLAVSDVAIFGVTYTTDCECPDEFPKLGECSLWSDNIPQCSCTPCAAVTTIRLPDQTLVWDSEDFARSSYSFWFAHGAAPGAEIAFEFDGCHGAFDASFTVPASDDIPLALDSVEEIDGSIQVRWSPAAGDAAIARAGWAFAGARCFGADTGEAVIPERLYPDSYVGVRTLYRVGAVEQPHAAIDVYRAAEVEAQPNMPSR